MSQRTFPKYTFSGTHREIGQQYGEACRDLIHQHLDIVQKRLSDRQGLSPSDAAERALLYRPYILRSAAFLDEEVQGVAEGAGLSLGEAYILQLRAELATPLVVRETEPVDECTSFAVMAEATADGIPLVGQNADLPAFYSDIAVVVEFQFDDMPDILMVTPAGQVSYLGLNNAGLGVGANFITCDGWRLGIPRYFFSRIALTTTNTEDAIAKVEGLDRASSRNMIFIDSNSCAADVEFVPGKSGRIDPTNGLIAHANHFLTPELLAEERAPAPTLENSQARFAQMRGLLDARHGTITAEVMQELLRTRDGAPDAICRIPDESDLQSSTVASIILRPSKEDAFIAAGPPHLTEYVHYTFSRSKADWSYD